MLLETLARLHDYRGDAQAEYPLRKRRMLLPQATPAHVLDTLRALAAVRGKTGAPMEADLRLVRAMFAQREALATEAERLLHAELLHTVVGLEDEAQRHLTRLWPAPDGMADRTFTLAAPEQVPPAMGALRTGGTEGGAAGLLTLKDAWVLPGLRWAPCLPQAGLLFGVFMTMKAPYHRQDAASPLLLRGKSRLRLRLPEAAPPSVEGGCVLLGGDGTSNYYHFLHEHLSRLAVLDALGGDTSGLRFGVGSGLLPFPHEFLALLGIGGERLVSLPADGALGFRELLAPLPLGRGGNFTSPLLARWARERLVPPALHDVRAGRKLFLSRARTARRRVVNEDEVFAVFAAHGYELVHPETLSVREQIALFAQASHIAGSGGAALTNMLFMPPGGHVLMLNNRYIPEHARSLYFGPLTQACGHSFRILSGEPVAFATERALDADLRLDPAAVQAWLRA